MHRLNVFVTLFVAFLLHILNPSALQAEDFDLKLLQQKIQETIERVEPSVVRITGRGSMFSGVIVSPDGKVLSVAHAVVPGRPYQITLPDGRRFRGVGKGANSSVDCALILITNPDDDLPHVPMGDSSSVVANQPVLGLSFPGGQQANGAPVIRFGRIVGQSRMMQTTALMEPGDSGGPLFDLNGSVIGIHSRIGKSMGQNFEVPINVFRKYWNELNHGASFTRSGPPTPKLGITCQEVRGEGIRIERVYEGRARTAGIKQGDMLTRFHGKEIDSLGELRRALNSARDEGVLQVTLVVDRDDETVELGMEFDVLRELPKTALPKEDHPEVPQAEGFKELRSLAEQLSDLESKLDDACVEILSDFGEEKPGSITGIRILNAPWIISKSSVVGSSPKIEVDGKVLTLEVMKRDRENDLVLLKSTQKHTAGIDLDKNIPNLEIGAFLLSPDADSEGTVSLLSSPLFRSPKQQSGGYLGVVPTTIRGGEGVRLDQVVREGAAKRAGLAVGDVITKLNDKPVRSQRELRAFLREVDPNSVITATLLRDDDELTKSITLGARPSRTNHAADRMEKSARRDGFQQVFSHDADLDPDQCGGPLFDIEGNFVGLNIARNSRVRCYAIPAESLRDFIGESQ